VSQALIEFPADDAERALRFWRGVLGVELVPRAGDAGSGWVHEEEGL
jgi:catechol 2,3-dioxygenase-like lactoylglutathione lyase family enzyme